jgi:hypothetical protein
VNAIAFVVSFSSRKCEAFISTIKNKQKPRIKRKVIKTATTKLALNLIGNEM